MRSRGSRVLFAFLVVLLPGLTSTDVQADDGHDFTVVDPEGIYFGSGEHPRAPAVIYADQVWANIPEYQRILDEGLSDDDPAYHLLLKKATERFQRALRRAAQRDGHDMIGEVGSIQASQGSDATVPDITRAVIDLVTRG